MITRETKDKAEQLAGLINKLQQESKLTIYKDEPINGEYDYADVEFTDIIRYFKSLPKIEKIYISESYWYASINKRSEERLDKPGAYIKQIINFPNLKELTVVNTNFIDQPDYILNIEKLESIGIIGNRFYKSNFHFKLKEQCNKNELLDNLIERKFIKNINLRRWGIYSYENSFNFIITFDNFINPNYCNSINIYLFTNNKYEYFKLFTELFSDLDEKLNCFKKKKNVNGKEVLDVFFYNRDDYENPIDYEELKQHQKEGKVKYNNDRFVNDLLEYLGGVELIADIEKEKEKEEIDKANQFYNENNFINSINIENFKAFENQTLNNLSAINVLVGKNSTGKTSLLQAIAAGLVPENNKDITEPASLINLKLKDNSFSRKYTKIKTKWSNYQKSQRIFEDQIILETIDGIKNELPQSYLLLAYGENIYTNKKPFDNYQDILKDGNYQSYHTKAIFSTTYESMINPLDLFYELSEGQIKESNREFKQELLGLVEIIFLKLNDFLSASNAKQISIKKDGAYYKFYDANQNLFLDFEQISEGYRSYIILIADIVFRILAARNKLLVADYKINEIFEKVKGVIIIDEFDKHMHPSWQRTFLSTLRKEFPLIQFFLSTHNIVSLQSAEGNKVFVISVKNNTIDIMHEEIPVGYSVEALYEHYFDEHLYSNEITKKLSAFKKIRNRILRSNDFGILKEAEFINTANELSRINSQLATIVETELYQLEKRRDNAQTK